jgi:hypothetical protein
MNREIRFIAHVLDPFFSGKIDTLSYLDSLNECNLIETLKKNNVAIKFERNIETIGVPREKFFYKFPRMKDFYRDMHAKIEKDTFEFDRIKDTFSRAGVEFMLIKSDGSFPYESDNLDILVKPNKLGKVMQLLKKAGYSELPQVREPHKFLFRKMHAFSELPLHIHTRVVWEGTQFVDSRNLWDKRRIGKENNGFFVPSPEDCILITTAHLFFENHEIKLDDLVKIDSFIRNCSINWDYICDHAQRLYWNDAFHLTMLLLNLVYKELYGRSMLRHSVLSKMEELDHGYIKPFLKIMKPFGVGPTPLRVPYAVAGFFFVQRVLRDLSLTLAGRFNHLGFIAYDVTKRKIRFARSSQEEYAMLKLMDQKNIHV